MKMQIKRLSLIFAVLFLFPFCPVSGQEAVSENTEPVRIGVPLPLTGSFRTFGLMMKNAFELAKERINREGGIKGRRVEPVYADTGGMPDQADAAVRSLVSKSGVSLLAGGYASNPTYAMAGTAEKLDIPFLICTASADRITQKNRKNIYRLNPPISEYTKGLEDFWIRNFKPRSIAIIYENSMFGTDGATRMMGFCRENAIEITSLAGYSRENTDPAYIRSLLAPLVAEPPDAVYMVAYLEDAVVLVKELKHLKIRALLCGGAGGFTQDEFMKQAGHAAEGLITTTLWSGGMPYPGAAEFYEEYKTTYGTAPDYHGAEAYSALLVVRDVLNRSASLESRDIRAALDRTFLMTPFGPVKFYNYEGFARQNSCRTQVLQIIGGQYQCIWPPDLATAVFVPPEK